MSNTFSITLTKNPKAKPDPEHLQFGTVFTDHMFLMDYSAGKGWHDARIVPYGPISLSPAASVKQFSPIGARGLMLWDCTNSQGAFSYPSV